MLSVEHANRLLSRAQHLAQLADDAMADAQTLAAIDRLGDAARWLPGLTQALTKIQLEAADLTFSARELRDSLPSPESLQPRLL